MDTVDLVIGKAEQLFACPGSGSIFPYKTEVCDFIAREKAFAFVRTWASPASSCRQLVRTSGAECMRWCEDLVRLISVRTPRD